MEIRIAYLYSVLDSQSKSHSLRRFRRVNQAIQVTGFTGSQGCVGYPDPRMALCDFVDLVVMASVASISGICARVAGLARHLACGHAVVKREAVRFEHGWLPGSGGVTGIAFQAK